MELWWGCWLLVLIASGTAVWDRQQGSSRVQLHAAMPENGGWSTDILYAQVGEPLNLQMVSDDVVHGFAGRATGRPRYPTLSRDTRIHHLDF